MPRQLVTVDALDARSVFPCLHLLRAFRIAIDFRKMFLGGLALSLLALGDWAFSALPFAPADETAGDPSDRFFATLSDPQPPGGRPAPGIIAVRLPNPDPSGGLPPAAGIGRVVLRPLLTVAESASVLIRGGTTWGEIADAWTRLLWALAVWAVFGGALTRMAAVQFGRDERVGMLAALKFSSTRFLSYLGAPLLPIAGIGIFWAIGAMLGLLGRIPMLGGVVVGIVWIVPLLLGVVMFLVLVGAALGWPLMYATISTEGSDGFDGFSRSYSYIFSRPWHYLGFAVAALLVGAISIFAVELAAKIVVHMASWCVGSGMGVDDVRSLQAGDGLGGRITGLWSRFVTLLVSGFVVSFFWSATTIVYFLLRYSDDRVGLHEVFVPEDDEEDELLPLAGVAASDQPAAERPVRPPADRASTPDSGDDVAEGRGRSDEE